MMDEKRGQPPEEEFLTWVREQHNPPGTTPVEEMWASIEGRLPGRRRALEVPLLRVAAGVILLLAGVGIGRFTAPGAEGASVTASSAIEVPEAGGTVAQPRTALLPTFAHLREADLLLSILTEEGSDEWVRDQSALWAESLLVETRILRDLHGDDESELTALLDELEVTLNLVAGLDEPEERANHLDALRAIVRTLQDGNLRTRIHSALPQSAS